MFMDVVIPTVSWTICITWWTPGSKLEFVIYRNVTLIWLTCMRCCTNQHWAQSTQTHTPINAVPSTASTKWPDCITRTASEHAHARFTSPYHFRVPRSRTCQSACVTRSSVPMSMALSASCLHPPSCPVICPLSIRQPTQCFPHPLSLDWSQVAILAPVLHSHFPGLSTGQCPSPRFLLFDFKGFYWRETAKFEQIPSANALYRFQRFSYSVLFAGITWGLACSHICHCGFVLCSAVSTSWISVSPAWAMCVQKKRTLRPAQGSLIQAWQLLDLWDSQTVLGRQGLTSDNVCNNEAFWCSSLTEAEANHCAISLAICD